MAFATTYTLSEARTMLNLWKECERELATGQAKHYRVGTREFTALDLKEIRASVKYWEDIVAQLSGQARTTKVVRVVPRDL